MYNFKFVYFKMLITNLHEIMINFEKILLLCGVCT